MGLRNAGRSDNRASGESLVEVEHVDDEGFKWRVKIPGFDMAHPERGIVIGPPDFSFLDLPSETHKRLHNAMYDRKLFTLHDLRGRGQDIFAALQSAYRVDVARITEAYDR